jgi:myo-inositol-1(or 4)-monophosphatase
MNLRPLLIECLFAGARLLKRYQHANITARIKESSSSVVTEADIASEQAMISLIERAFPHHNVLAEESGFRSQGSAFTWVLDPLDGTSNYAAGLPWFGLIVAVLEGTEPICAGMYLPVQDVLYLSDKGRGVERNGVPIRLPGETQLRETLWAYGMDASADPEQCRRQTELLGRLLGRVRNVRSTNSLIDVCYLLDGGLGGFINQHTKIWDVSAIRLMLPEAGGVLTDLAGAPIEFSLAPDTWSRNYQVMGSTPALIAQVLAGCLRPV